MQAFWWWFVLGYLLAKYQGRLLRFRVGAWVLALIAYPVALYQVVHFRETAFVPILNMAGVIGSTFLVWILVKLWLGRPLAHIGRHTLEIYAGEFLFLSLPLATSVFRVPVVTTVAVLGSLALGMLLRLTPLTNMLFLGGRYDSGTKFLHEAPSTDVLASDEPAS